MTDSKQYTQRDDFADRPSTPSYTDPVPDQLKSHWRKEIEKAYKLAVTELGYAGPMPRIDWSLRRMNTAAVAKTQVNEISINTVIALQNTGQDFISDTAAHEVAHLVAHHFGGRGHDRVWKRIASTLGATPQASGRFQTAGSRARNTRRYPFICDCQGHDLGLVRTRKAIDHLPAIMFRCRKCHAGIRPDEKKIDHFDEAMQASIAATKTGGKAPRAKLHTEATFPFVCRCSTHSLASAKAMNVLKASGGRRYVCRHCKGALKPDHSNLNAFTPKMLALMKL